MSYECNYKWEEVCVDFCHVSNRQARQTYGSVEMNVFCSRGNLHLAREGKEI